MQNREFLRASNPWALFFILNKANSSDIIDKIFKSMKGHMEGILKYSKIRDVKDPIYATNGSVGIDFFVPNDLGPYEIDVHESTLVPSGIKVNLTDGYCLIAFNKSGIAAKKHLIVGACTIDSDFMGEIFINMINVGQQKQILNPGDKIVQFVLMPAYKKQLQEVKIEDLYEFETERGEGGFGSTDKKDNLK